MLAGRSLPARSSSQWPALQTMAPRFARAGAGSRSGDGPRTARGTRRAFCNAGITRPEPSSRPELAAGAVLVGWGWERRARLVEAVAADSEKRIPEE